ncbi:hypothetical protein [Phormidesmis priestleyi]
MNTQLIESLVQAVRSLLEEERSLFETKLYREIPYPSNLELAHLRDRSKAFDFLKDEPDLYTIEDGESIKWE